jgi:hypothetical protein
MGIAPREVYRTHGPPISPAKFRNRGSTPSAVPTGEETCGRGGGAGSGFGRELSRTETLAQRVLARSHR